MADTVDEERRCPVDPAAHAVDEVSSDAVVVGTSVQVPRCPTGGINRRGCPAKVIGVDLALMGEQPVMRLPEPTACADCFGQLRGEFGVRVDVGQGKCRNTNRTVSGRCASRVSTIGYAWPQYGH